MASAPYLLLRSQKNTNLPKSILASRSASSSDTNVVVRKSFEEHQEEFVSNTRLISSSHSLASFFPSLKTLQQRSDPVLPTKSLHTTQRLPRNEGNVRESIPKETDAQNVIPRHTSVPELNTESEIRFIEENVRQNELLKLLRRQECEDDSSDEDSQQCNSIADPMDKST